MTPEPDPEPDKAEKISVSFPSKQLEEIRRAARVRHGGNVSAYLQDIEQASREVTVQPYGLSQAVLEDLLRIVAGAKMPALRAALAELGDSTTQPEILERLLTGFLRFLGRSGPGAALDTPVMLTFAEAAILAARRTDHPLFDQLCESLNTREPFLRAVAEHAKGYGSEPVLRIPEADRPKGRVPRDQTTGETG